MIESRLSSRCRVRSPHGRCVAWTVGWVPREWEGDNGGGEGVGECRGLPALGSPYISPSRCNIIVIRRGMPSTRGKALGPTRGPVVPSVVPLRGRRLGEGHVVVARWPYTTKNSPFISPCAGTRTWFRGELFRRRSLNPLQCTKTLDCSKVLHTPSEF